MQNPGLASVQGARVFVYFFLGFFLGCGDMSSIGALEGVLVLYGFRIRGLGFRVQGIRVQGLGFGVKCFGFGSIPTGGSFTSDSACLAGCFLGVGFTLLCAGAARVWCLGLVSRRTP